MDVVDPEIARLQEALRGDDPDRWGWCEHLVIKHVEHTSPQSSEDSVGVLPESGKRVIEVEGRGDCLIYCCNECLVGDVPIGWL